MVKRNTLSSLRPNIALLLFIVLLLTLAVKLVVPIREGDLWWQMAYGRYLLANNTLIPDHTIFSWTPADGSIIYCAWIAEIFLYILYETGGLLALFIFKYCCFLFFIYLFWRQAVKNQVTHHPFTWLIGLLGFLMTDQAAYVKPEIFSLVFIVLTAWTWNNFKDTDGRACYCYFFPLYVLLWVNSHGAFIFGLTYLGCLWAGEIFNVLFSPKQALTLKKLKHFSLSLFFCLAAVLITPYGWDYPAQLFNNLFLGGLDVKHYEMVTAYQSILDKQFWSIHFIDYMGLSIIIVFLLLLPGVKARRIDFSFVLTTIVFLWLFTRFLRTTYFWGVIFTFSSLPLLAHFLPYASLHYKQTFKLAKHFAVIIFLLLATRSIYDSIFVFHGPNWFSFGNSYVNPEDESRFIKKNYPGLRLGNDYDTGGYLLWDLWPETKIFIDPRYFPFRSWFVEYRQFVSGKNPSFIDKFPCDLWCLKLEYPVVNNFLQSDTWKLVYYGPSACIFVKKDILKSDSALVSSDSLSNIKSLPQAFIAFQFAVRINDLNTAKRIVESLKFNRFIPSHRSLTAQMNNSYGTVLFKNRRYNEAEKYFNKALDLAPKYADAYSNLGALYFIANNPGKAIENYRKAIGIDPNKSHYYFSLAMVMLAQGDIDNAATNFQQSLNLVPDQPAINYYLGKIFSDKQNYNQAITYFHEALRLNPNFIEALNDLGQVYCKTAEYSQAIQCYKKVIELQPNLSKHYYNIACLYAKLNEKDMALQWLKLAIDKGYCNWDKLRTDQDLDNIRWSSEYRNLMKDAPSPLLILK